MRPLRTLLLTHLLCLGAASAQDTVKVGVITSLTGPLGTAAIQQQAGFKVALAEVNATGGINGRPLDLLIEDDAGDAGQGTAAAERLMESGVPLVIGSYSGTVTRALAPLLTEKKVPLLVATATEETITKPGSPYVYRLNSPVTLYTTSIVDAIKRAGTLKTAVLLASNDAFGKSVQADAQRLLKTAGIDLLAQDSFDPGTADFRTVLRTYQARNPDVVLLVATGPEAVAIARQAQEVKLRPRLTAGIGPGFATPEFIRGAGTASENVVVPVNWNPDVKYPGAALLYARLKSALGGTEPTQVAAQAYAAVITAADALKRASGDPSRLPETLKATRLNTAYGQINFRTYGGFQNQNSVVGLVTQVQGGKFLTVGPANAARNNNKLILPRR